MSQEKISQLIVEQRNITQAMEALYSEIVTLENSINDRRRAIEFLEMYMNTDEDVEILLPVGGGLYLHAIVPRQDRVYANIGSQIYLFEKVEETIPKIKDSIEKLSKLLDERRSLLNRLKARYDEITAELTELYFKERGK